MALKCGIIGLPNVGKSTLFNCLSNAKAQAANFPFCTIEPNVGTIIVPDERLETLAKLINPQNTVPTTIEIVDIAGLVKGASKGEGLGNKFLGNIRECNTIIHVLRCFEDENITHIDENIDPLRDKEIIETELQLKDLESLETHIAKVEKQAKSGADKVATQKLAVFTKVKKHIETGNNAKTLALEGSEQDYLDSLFLLTNKPVIYLCNVEETAATSGNMYVEKIKSAVNKENAEVLTIAVSSEAEIATLETYEDRQLFLQELGLEEAGVNKLIKAAYSLLGLQTFFTAGEKEVRAWTVKKGATAPEAAGVIHTDFQTGFIKAEVISYNDYIDLKSEAAARTAGKLRIEGKDYVLQDGDVVHFRFNV